MAGRPARRAIAAAMASLKLTSKVAGRARVKVTTHSHTSLVSQLASSELSGAGVDSYMYARVKEHSFVIPI